MKYDISKNKIKLHDSLTLDVIGELKAIMDEEFPKKSKKWVGDLKELTSIEEVERVCLLSETQSEEL